MSRLGVGEFIAWIPSFHNQAVFGTFKPLRLPGELSEAARKASAERFLKRVEFRGAETPVTQISANMISSSRTPTEPAARQSADPTAEVLAPVAVNLLNQVATGIPQRLMHLYDNAGVSRSEGVNLVKHLERAGYVRPHRFTTGKQGGAIALLEPTARAWSYLAPFGITPPASLTGGGWEHELGARLLQAVGKRQHMRIRFEVLIGDVRLDVEWRDPQGHAIFFNVGVSDPAREIVNARRALAAPALEGNTLTIVCRDVDFARKVKDHVKQIDDGGNTARRIQIALITDFLP